MYTSLVLYSTIFALSMERTRLTFHCWLYNLCIVVYVTNKTWNLRLPKGRSGTFRCSMETQSLHSERSHSRTLASSSPITWWPPFRQSDRSKMRFTLDICTSSLSQMSRGVGDSPTLALPTGASPRKPLILVTLLGLHAHKPSAAVHCLDDGERGWPKKNSSRANSNWKAVQLLWQPPRPFLDSKMFNNMDVKYLVTG